MWRTTAAGSTRFRPCYAPPVRSARRLGPDPVRVGDDCRSRSARISPGEADSRTLLSRLLCPAGQWQLNHKCGPAARLGFEPECALMPLHDDRVRNGQALTGSFTDRFGSEERIEYLGSNRLRNARTAIPDTNFDECVSGRGADLDGTFLGGILDLVGDGVSRIHDQVEDHLIEFAGDTRNRREVGLEIHLHIGDVLPLIS